MASSAKRHKPNPSLSSLLTSAMTSTHTFLLHHSHLLPPSLSLPLDSLLSSSLRRLSLPPLPIPSPLSPQSFLHLLSLLPNLSHSSLSLSLLILSNPFPFPLSRRPSLPSPIHSFFSTLKSISHNPHLFLPPFPPTAALGISKFGPLSVLAAVDSRGRFLHVSAGWPADLSPAAILRQTKLYLAAEEMGLDGGCEFLFGDACFPTLTWLLTPYRGGEDREVVFNERHGEAMRVLRRAFGRVRKRWGILRREWRGESVEFLPFVILVCCFLHNFVETCGGDEIVDDGVEEEGFGVYDGEGSESGERVRDAVADRFLLEKKMMTSVLG